MMTTFGRRGGSKAHTRSNSGESKGNSFRDTPGVGKLVAMGRGVARPLLHGTSEVLRIERAYRPTAPRIKRMAVGGD